MSNIHGLNDLNRNNQNGVGYNRMNQRMGVNPQPMMMDEEAKEAVGLFASASGESNPNKPPREESYWDMWQTTFCPAFSPLKFTFIVWVLNTVIYIVTLGIAMFSGNYRLNDNAFLGPDPEILNNWGALNQYEIRVNWQVWRLLTYMFLTPGFSVWGINSVLTLIIGFMVENNQISSIMMACIYISIGVLTGLFTAACEY